MIKFDYITDPLDGILGSTRAVGKSVRVNNVSAVKCPLNNSIIFVQKSKWKDEYKNSLETIKDCLIILEQDINLNVEIVRTSNQIIISENARLDYAKILNKILGIGNKGKKYKTMENSIIVGEDVVLGSNVILEPFTFIDSNVRIGDNCLLKTGAKIRSNVVLGQNVIIGENSVIGAQGFGIEMDEAGDMYRIPHIGGVIIKDNVEVGALVSIVSGTIEPTVISENVMVDDLVHIAHNCFIGGSTMITACTQISGSAMIGEKCYIAPNSTIRNGIQIGKESFIGQASAVTKDFSEHSVVGGNPAMSMNKLKIMRKIINQSVDEYQGDTE